MTHNSPDSPVTNQVFDAIVIGGGPAGSTCAYKYSLQSCRCIEPEYPRKFPTIFCRDTKGGGFTDRLSEFNRIHSGRFSPRQRPYR